MERKISYRLKVSETPVIREELLHLRGPWVVHPHGPVHELNSILCAGPHDFIELRHVHGYRLLEKEVLTLAGSHDRPVDMEAGRKWDVDGIHLRVVKEGVVGAVELGLSREGVVSGELGGLL